MERSTKAEKTALGLNIVIAGLECLAWLVLIPADENTFFYYTNDSNFLALLCAFLYIAYWLHHGKTSRFTELARYLTTTVLSITFLVVVLVLSPMTGPMGWYILLFTGTFRVTHLLVPLCSFVSFLFFEDASTLRRQDAGLAFLATFLYALVMIILNLFRVTEGPYPFLRVYDQSLLASAVWLAVILGGAYGIGFGLLSCKRKFGKRRKNMEKEK